jgi:hypothetical protein
VVYDRCVLCKLCCWWSLYDSPIDLGRGPCRIYTFLRRVEALTEMGVREYRVYGLHIPAFSAGYGHLQADPENICGTQSVDRESISINELIYHTLDYLDASGGNYSTRDAAFHLLRQPFALTRHHDTGTMSASRVHKANAKTFANLSARKPLFV